VINIVTLFTFLLMLEVVLKLEDVVMLVHVTKVYNDEIQSLKVVNKNKIFVSPH
jgi:hypothetical protein